MTRLFGLQWASCQDGLIGLASGTALGAASMVVRQKVQWSSGVEILSHKTSAWFHMSCFFGCTLVFTWIPQGVHWCKSSSLESYLAHLRNIFDDVCPTSTQFCSFQNSSFKKPIVDIWIWTHQASFLGTHLWWPVKFPLSAAQASGRFTGCCREDRTGRWRCRARPLSWLLRLAETSTATLPPRGEEPIVGFFWKGRQVSWKISWLKISKIVLHSCSEYCLPTIITINVYRDIPQDFLF